MIIFFSLLSLLLSPTISLNKKKPNLCINCKYFITDNRIGRYGKCSLFPKDKNNEVFNLVTGVDVNTEYMYCYTTREREDLCGKDGTLYRKKYRKREV